MSTRPINRRLDIDNHPDWNVVFNEDGLLEKLDHDVAVFQEVIQVFIEDVSDRIERLADMVDSFDFKHIADEAHTIKGAAATIEAGLFKKAAFDLESNAVGENGSGVIEMYGRLKAGFNYLKEILEKTIN